MHRIRDYSMLDRIKAEIRKHSNPEKAKILSRFFKTGKGEYGEGDIFLGISVPQSRCIAKKFSGLPFRDVKALLKSKIHEERLVALLILVHDYQSGSEKQKNDIFDFYLKNTKYINNWDLVDLSSEKIVGAFVFDKQKDILYRLAKSENIWERRISIVATFHFIKNNQFSDTLKIAELLLGDKHDLIQKAVGWMLREVGKRSLKTEEQFLERHYRSMPRTALRYAIERFPDGKKRSYMKKS